MNPITHTLHATNTQTLRDVLPPRAKASTVPTVMPSQTTQSSVLKPEIVQGIPVKSPIEPGELPAGAVTIANPINRSANANHEPAKEGDKHLDQILKDVNQSVKESGDSVEDRFEHLSGVRKKVAVKKAKAEESRGTPVPIAATVVAVLVASILTVSAYLTFSHG